MNPVADVISKESGNVITPGFLETSEETICMKSLKDHPKCLEAYEEICTLENIQDIHVKISNGF